MSPIQLSNASTAVPLAAIQANILRPHGRKHAWCLLIRFKAPTTAPIAWLSRFADRLTPAEKQKQDARIRRKHGIDGGTIVCFFLSAKGFQALGFPLASMPSDPSFRLGMSHSYVNSGLQDPVPGKWEETYRKNIDAMILLADDRTDRLEAQHQKIDHSLQEAGAGKIVAVEKGKKLTLGDPSAPLEHFGYRDGISQPVFFDEQGRLLPDRLKMALLDDPPYEGGSYLVFRKLEQDVKGFHRKMRDLTELLDLNGNHELAGAQIIGRFKDGTPLTLYDSPRGLPINDFDYLDDTGGWKCPFHAHVRKSNPKSGAASEVIRIIRRGIPYGDRTADLSDQPESGVGLLFMSYQASITSQFEHILRNWCNDIDYPQFETGIDPLIGQRIKGNQAQLWNKGWNTGRHMKVAFSLRDVVRLKGGAYFFAPAISWLKNIAGHLTVAVRAGEGHVSNSRSLSEQSPYDNHATDTGEQ